MGKLLFLLGVFMMWLATLIGLVDVVYQWSHTMEFPQALWDGVVLWLEMLSVGAVFTITGLVLHDK